MRSKRVSVGLVVLVAAAVALSACGRRGAPELPPQAGPGPLAEGAAVPSDALVTVPTPGAREPTAPPPVLPDRPFILDAIL